MPIRCNRGFYCRSYCLLNMFRAPLCPSSGAQEFYTVVAACGISYCGFSSCCSGVELTVMCPVCRMLQLFEKLRKMTISFVMFVRLSVRMEQLGFHWKDFNGFWFMSVFLKYAQKIQVSLISHNNNVYFMWIPIYFYDHISPISS